MLTWFIGERMVGIGLIVGAILFAAIMFVVVWLVNRSRDKRMATARPLASMFDSVTLRSPEDTVLDEDKDRIWRLLQEDLEAEKDARARERLTRVAFNQRNAVNQGDPEPLPRKKPSA